MAPGRAFPDGLTEARSRLRLAAAARSGVVWEATYGRPLSEMPTHGCTENLSGVLAPYGIAMEDVPSPFNIFQDMIIREKTGVLEHSPIRPKPPGAQIHLRAPGSGGFGAPAERDRAKLRDDVINGYVSPESAVADYGYREPEELKCPACGSAVDVGWAYCLSCGKPTGFE